jgi:hypothetical protein
VVSWIFAHVVVKYGYLSAVPPVSTLRKSVDPTSRMAQPVRGGRRGFCDEQALVVEHLRRTCSKGSDVRMSTACLFDPSAFPRMAVEPALWRWKTVITFSWRQQAHINELEMRAYLSAFKWRLRTAEGVQQRFLHLLDSQVSISVLTKHRSSSIRLNRVARKINALELASGSAGCFGFVRSNKQPADAPSRIAHGAKKGEG